jgi:hypothetical protein
MKQSLGQKNVHRSYVGLVLVVGFAFGRRQRRKADRNRIDRSIKSFLEYRCA